MLKSVASGAMKGAVVAVWIPVRTTTEILQQVDIALERKAARWGIITPRRSSVREKRNLFASPRRKNV